jgi:hypothetical protein
MCRSHQRACSATGSGTPSNSPDGGNGAASRPEDTRTKPGSTMPTGERSPDRSPEHASTTGGTASAAPRSGRRHAERRRATEPGPGKPVADQRLCPRAGSGDGESPPTTAGSRRLRRSLNSRASLTASCPAARPRPSPAHTPDSKDPLRALAARGLAFYTVQWQIRTRPVRRHYRRVTAAHRRVPGADRAKPGQRAVSHSRSRGDVLPDERARQWRRTSGGDTRT